MATTFKKANKYDHGNEEWCHYVERLDHFFTVNKITDKDKMQLVFLLSMGAKTYKLICSLVVPGDPKELTCEELAKIVEEHYQPKPSVIVQCFEFNRRIQQSGETIPVFLAQLRCLPKSIVNLGRCLMRCYVIVSFVGQKMRKFNVVY